jgi:hypothetical protein
MRTRSSHRQYRGTVRRYSRTLVVDDGLGYYLSFPIHEAVAGADWYLPCVVDYRCNAVKHHPYLYSA